MEKYYGWGLPIDISTQGPEIDRLIYVVHGLMAALFIGWFAYLVIALVRFRQRPGHAATYQLNHFKAPSYVEVAVAIFEILLLVGFSFPVLNHVRNVFPDPAKALQVRIVAEQFVWNVHYPGDDGIFGKTDIHLISGTNPVGLDSNDPAAKDDIVMINQFHVPVHKPVIVRLSSKDVIHSFSIPVMRVKQDVIPGQTIPVWFEATKTGSFEIACAQLCGLGHYRMRGFFTVETEDQFHSWLNSMKPPEPAPANMPTAPAMPAAPPTPASSGGVTG